MEVDSWATGADVLTLIQELSQTNVVQYYDIYYSVIIIIINRVTAVTKTTLTVFDMSLF